MNKIFKIISREYLTRVRKPVFYITTFLLPLLFAGFSLTVGFIIGSKGKALHVAVVDESVKGYIRNKIMSDDKDMFYKIETMPYNKITKCFDALQYDAVIYIPKDFELQNARGIELISKVQLGIDAQGTMEKKVNKVIYSCRLKEKNVDEAIVDDANKDVSLDVKVLSGQEAKEGNAAVGTIIGLIAGVLVYTMMFLYGNMVMRSVMEEKQTRIVEVIMSSVKPFELMMGKIIGVGLVGLTQFFLWMILTLIVQVFMGIAFHDQMMAINTTQSGVANADPNSAAVFISQVMHLPWIKILSCFMFYFLGGYLLYAALFAAVGSAMSEDMEDNRVLNFIISSPLIIAYVMMWSTLKDPNNSASIAGSIIPLTSPIVMMARIPLGVPTYQLISSMLLLIGGFLFMTWVAARIYRTAILLYGKKITPAELLKWSVRSK